MHPWHPRCWHGVEWVRIGEVDDLVLVALDSDIALHSGSGYTLDSMHTCTWTF